MASKPQSPHDDQAPQGQAGDRRTTRGGLPGRLTSDGEFIPDGVSLFDGN